MDRAAVSRSALGNVTIIDREPQETEAEAVPTALAFGTALPRAPLIERPPRKRIGRPFARRVVIVAVLIGVLWFVQGRLVTPLIHDQRQLHDAAAIETPKAALVHGDALGFVQVPTLSINEAFVEGIEIDDLRGGPGHLPGSGLPGDAGVMVLLGHRTTYGAPFAAIDELVQGDDIVVRVRNGGPIVRYVVDRVERHTHLDSLEFDRPELISYLVLATSEPGVFTRDQVLVVARALPVTDAESIVPDLANVGETVAPFDVETLLALLSVAAGVLAHQFMRRRTLSSTVVWITLAPIGGYAAIRLLMTLETLLPLTR